MLNSFTEKDLEGPKFIYEKLEEILIAENQAKSSFIP